MKRLFPLMAGFLATAHVALVVLAMVCLFEHAMPTAHAQGHSHHSHHGSTTSAHSSLCMWACEGGSFPALVSQQRTEHPTLSSVTIFTAPLSLHVPRLSGLLAGRSPPVHFPVI